MSNSWIVRFMLSVVIVIQTSQVAAALRHCSWNHVRRSDDKTNPLRWECMVRAMVRAGAPGPSASRLLFTSSLSDLSYTFLGKFRRQALYVTSLGATDGSSCATGSASLAAKSGRLPMLVLAKTCACRRRCVPRNSGCSAPTQDGSGLCVGPAGPGPKRSYIASLASLSMCS